MELAGKRVAFLGDSITAGYACVRTENRFTDRLARRFSLAAENYGVSGTCIARERPGSPFYKKERAEASFLDRAGSMAPGADLVFVLGGVNDCSLGIPLDAYGGTDPYTFYGALRTLYASLRARFPAAVIAVATPIPWVDQDDPTPSHGAPLQRYAAAERETADDFGFPVLDLLEVSGLRPCDPAFRAACMPDGIHPNDDCHGLLTDVIGAFLQGLAPAAAEQY